LVRVKSNLKLRGKEAQSSPVVISQGQDAQIGYNLNKIFCMKKGYFCTIYLQKDKKTHYSLL
jgi:hypothetical protein